MRTTLLTYWILAVGLFGSLAILGFFSEYLRDSGIALAVGLSMVDVTSKIAKPLNYLFGDPLRWVPMLMGICWVGVGWFFVEDPSITAMVIRVSIWLVVGFALVGSLDAVIKAVKEALTSNPSLWLYSAPRILAHSPKLTDIPSVPVTYRWEGAKITA